ncbi:8-amino-7-oxononanoate synthase [Longispora albida]|uniref:8-amino-7-oxononanoate synthase n=1 Tax=Longispora albida TaxID=203523 RepID=UPI0003758062|nr:8-amino-7-oxononanoate synthase [Longispora albida]
MTWERLERKAALRAKAGLTRRTAPRDGDAIDLAGNDYLGLSRHPQVITAAAKALTRYGLGATGSRLVRGTTAEHEKLESELAEWTGFGSALVYSSGYLANLGILKALSSKRTRLLADAHAHASLIDGCRASGATVEVIEHNSVPSTLDADCIVVVESIYSVDGDLAPLAELHAACRSAGALLLVDDAHGLGVIGQQGSGGAADAGIAGEPDVIVTATLSKALGAAGGVVLGPAALRAHLVDTGRTFIYDTAPPPAVVAGARAALHLARGFELARGVLHERAAKAAVALGVPEPAGGVLSVPAPSPQAAVDWAADCRIQGVAVGCFRPPSTPDGTARLRLTINAGVPNHDFDRALEVVSECAPS